MPLPLKLWQLKQLDVRMMPIPGAGPADCPGSLWQIISDLSFTCLTSSKTSFTFISSYFELPSSLSATLME